MDISQTGQKLLTYLYSSIFTPYEEWEVSDPGIDGIECVRWGKEKGIESSEVTRGIEELESLGLIRVIGFSSSEATLTAEGVQRVEASDWADVALIVRQQEARGDIGRVLTPVEEGMRENDVMEAAGVTQHELNANVWYLVSWVPLSGREEGWPFQKRAYRKAQ